MPSFALLHRWFAKSRWIEPSGTRDCAFAMSHGGSGLFEHLERNPEIATNFNMMNEHMQFPATGVYPFESTGIDWSRQESVMVDVGGWEGPGVRGNHREASVYEASSCASGSRGSAEASSD